MTAYFDFTVLLANRTDPCQTSAWRDFTPESTMVRYCYLATTLSQQNAREICRTLGGPNAMLASVEDDVELQYIHDIARY